MIVALAAATALASHPVYRAALTTQLIFYALCAVGALLPAGNRPLRVLRLFPMFASMNIALLVGFWRGLRGQGTGIWVRTARIQDAR
jgi:hypothetical protein